MSQPGQPGQSDELADPVDLCALEDLEDGGARRFDVAGHRLAVVRIDQSVYVIGDRCTHAEASLADGEVDTETLHIECWRHGSSFSLVTGRPDVPPATKPTPVHTARVVEGRVVVVLASEPSPDRAEPAERAEEVSP